MGHSREVTLTAPQFPVNFGWRRHHLPPLVITPPGAALVFDRVMKQLRRNHLEYLNKLLPGDTQSSSVLSICRIRWDEVSNSRGTDAGPWLPRPPSFFFFFSFRFRRRVITLTLPNLLFGSSRPVRGRQEEKMDTFCSPRKKLSIFSFFFNKYFQFFRIL